MWNSGGHIPSCFIMSNLNTALIDEKSNWIELERVQSNTFRSFEVGSL